MLDRGGRSTLHPTRTSRSEEGDLSPEKATEVPPLGLAALREANSRVERRPTVTFVRHGEPDWAPGGEESVNDPRLTPFGVAQADATARRLADEGIDAIYVSPYQRSQQTAAALERVTGIEPVTIEGLAEIGVAVEGRRQDQVDRYFQEAARRPLHEHWDGWPGAETFHEFHARVTLAITEMLARHGGTASNKHDLTAWTLADEDFHIAIVAHGGTNAVGMTHLLDIRPVPWEWIRFETFLAAFSDLQARRIGPRDHVWCLRSFNRSSHLPKHAEEAVQ